MTEIGVMRATVAVLASARMILGARLIVVSAARDRAEAHVLRLLDGCSASPADGDHL